jgi:hypothetical protein
MRGIFDSRHSTTTKTLFARIKEVAALWCKTPQRENPNCFELSWGVFFFLCCLIFDLLQLSFLLFLALYQYKHGRIIPVLFKIKNKSKGRTFGIRRGFFEAYSHNLPILLSLGSSSCSRAEIHAQSINRSTTVKATTWSHLTKNKRHAAKSKPVFWERFLQGSSCTA